MGRARECHHQRDRGLSLDNWVVQADRERTGGATHKGTKRSTYEYCIVGEDLLRKREIPHWCRQCRAVAFSTTQAFPTGGCGSPFASLRTGACMALTPHCGGKGKSTLFEGQRSPKATWLSAWSGTIGILQMRRASPTRSGTTRLPATRRRAPCRQLDRAPAVQDQLAEGQARGAPAQRGPATTRGLQRAQVRPADQLWEFPRDLHARALKTG